MSCNHENELCPSAIYYFTRFKFRIEKRKKMRASGQTLNELDEMINASGRSLFAAPRGVNLKMAVYFNFPLSFLFCFTCFSYP